MLRIALLLGGPSDERGISLNSARSVADHVPAAGVELAVVIYYDTGGRAYAIEPKRLYSNTPKDFDFRLTPGERLGDGELADLLRSVDLVFPTIHGDFGEDGKLQTILDGLGIAYVGSGAVSCKNAYDKFRARNVLADAGIETVESVQVLSGDPVSALADAIETAADAWGRVCIKPTRSGSSFDVAVLDDAVALRATADALLGLGTAGELRKRAGRTTYDSVLLQPAMTGRECTTVVIEGPAGPVALVPTEIEIRDEHNKIFTFKHKYLPHEGTRYHVPPRLSSDVVAAIRAKTEQVFSALGMRDFARIDGWLTEDGRFVISDVNPISGMEQTSFLFIQGAQVGLNHADLLRTVILAATRRLDLAWDPPPSLATTADERQTLPVLFGGDTAERDVSVTSGINVWLKLLGSSRFAPQPFLLGRDGEVWGLPYALALQHTVDNILTACEEAADRDTLRAEIAVDVQRRLELKPEQLGVAAALPQKTSFQDFVAEQRSGVVFLALHGGMGEDGQAQRLLDEHGIRYNGSGPDASKLCMDKADTGAAIEQLGDADIRTAQRIVVEVPTELSDEIEAAMWAEITAACKTEVVIAKPIDDGCSAGVVPLVSRAELGRYLRTVFANNHSDERLHISGRDFHLLKDDGEVDMPQTHQARLMFENYIYTDSIEAIDATEQVPAHLVWGHERDTGWIEITVGVLGRAGDMRAMTPSVTVVGKGVLTLEEKFMGGTGVNLTPPPESQGGKVAPGAISAAQRHVETVANHLGLRGYARIDAFMNRETGEIIVIEVNTLPGLTPATVIYHQGLEEVPSLPPRDLLEYIVDLALAPELVS